MNIGFELPLLSFFRNMSSSPRKRASTARVLEKSMMIRFLVAIAPLKARMILSTCRAVAGPERLE